MSYFYYMYWYRPMLKTLTAKTIVNQTSYNVIQFVMSSIRNFTYPTIQPKTNISLYLMHQITHINLYLTCDLLKAIQKREH